MTRCSGVSWAMTSTLICKLKEGWNMQQITLGSLFDGIGGWPLAALHSRVRSVWASEIEKYPQAVTKVKFPDMVQLGDITQIDVAKIEPVDIICMGSPCQDLSVAGRRSIYKQSGKKQQHQSGKNQSWFNFKRNRKEEPAHRLENRHTSM